jgi:glycosyltransferase involved in cell wall biosynthesis
MLDNVNNEVTIYMPSLGGGGAEKSVIRLMHGFIQRDINVTLVLATPHGILHDEIPVRVKVINLNSNRSIYSIIKLSSYINNHKPKVIISFLSRANRNALISKLIARKGTRVCVVEQNTISMGLKNTGFIRRFLALLIFKILYPHADKIINVSEAAADDLSKLLPRKSNKVITINNPIVDNNMLNGVNDNPPHEWLQSKDVPVILGVGRLMEQKNFLNLINAFAIVKKHRNARLIILGEGEQRILIEREIKKNNLKDSVILPGFVRDPLRYMKHSSLFVLSSNWEGLPTVLVEALACGCPVVSTDCPSGPREILDEGKYGKLVPTNDSSALGNAILESLDSKIDREILRRRAAEYSIEKVTDRYINILGLVPY